MDGVFRLEEPPALDPTVAGGKAATLARLRKAGLPVLDGIVVSSAAVARVLSRITRSPEARTSRVAAIENSMLDKDISEQIKQLSSGLGDVFAVRSSGLQEDGSTASWAGQFDSIIGVESGPALDRAVLRCIASMFTDRSVSYREHHQAPEPSLAVLIQPIVEPVCAGVMFTVNPLTGSWREMTVEAGWGQAAPVVQGELIPDFYRLRRPRRSPRSVQRVMSRWRIEVVEDRVREQHVKWTVGRDGLLKVPVDPARQAAPKLRHQQLLRLCRLGLRIEALRGGPQDVEWALTDAGRFVILQARPVTTDVGVKRVGPTLWSRRFIGERWTEPATPLGWSIMGGLLSEFIAYPETTERYLGGGDAMQMVRFAPYLNVSVFRHLAFKLPGAPPPQFMMELLPAQEQHAWRRRHAQRPDVSVYLSILAETVAGLRWRKFSPGLWSNPTEWHRFSQRLSAEIPALETPSETVAEAISASKRCKELAREYIGVHVCSLLWANVLHQTTTAALEAVGHGDIADDALRPVSTSWTVKTNHALWRLGHGTLSMVQFLEEYGHRASSSWELFSPRWADSELVVKRLAASAALHADPMQLAEAQSRRAAKAVESLNGWLQRLVSQTQVYLALREDQRFHFDRLLHVWSRHLQAIESLTGIEVRFLEEAELQRYSSGDLAESEVQRLVTERKEQWLVEVERRAKGDEPSNFLIGAEALVEYGQGERMQGVGVSPGVVTARVRVLRHPEEADRLRLGEILVARATDPGWTPLFLKASGVIMEIGGMLSHGAVVAREYNLPAVVNVPGLMKTLEDGQVVTMDGRQGAIWVIPDTGPVVA